MSNNLRIERVVRSHKIIEVPMELWEDINLSLISKIAYAVFPMNEPNTETYEGVVQFLKDELNISKKEATRALMELELNGNIVKHKEAILNE